MLSVLSNGARSADGIERGRRCHRRLSGFPGSSGWVGCYLIAPDENLDSEGQITVTFYSLRHAADSCGSGGYDPSPSFTRRSVLALLIPSDWSMTPSKIQSSSTRLTSRPLASRSQAAGSNCTRCPTFLVKTSPIHFRESICPKPCFQGRVAVPVGCAIPTASRAVPASLSVITLSPDSRCRSG